MTAVDFSAWDNKVADYLRIRDTQRSDYYRNEVAQSHGLGDTLSWAELFTNTNVFHLNEIEKRP